MRSSTPPNTAQRMTDYLLIFPGSIVRKKRTPVAIELRSRGPRRSASGLERAAPALPGISGLYPYLVLVYNLRSSSRQGVPMDIAAFRTPGLGDTTYLLTHEGVGILVDPQRDVDRFIDFADGAGIRIGHVLETHLHNDYVSGGREAARRSRAQLVLPAAAGAAFEHVPAFHLEDLEAEAQLTIRPIHTPGHTPEHVSYLVLLDRRPVALFSGGSLLAGSAGRTDLLGPARAGQLGVLQFGSLQRLAALPDEVPLYPTHGAGSFCSASLASRGTSTIGHEKAFNPALAHRDAAE